MAKAAGWHRPWYVACLLVPVASAVTTNTSAPALNSAGEPETTWSRDVPIRLLVRDFVTHLNVDSINFIIEGSCAVHIFAGDHTLN